MPVSSPPAEPPDRQLVAAARGGDAKAFEALIHRHYGMVYAIAYARLRQREAAEDLAQEAFLRVYLALDAIADPARFGAYVGRVARNLALNWVRDGRRASTLATMVPLDDDHQAQLADHLPTPHDLAAERSALATLQAALDRLPAEERELVVLHFLEELSQREVAERVGVNHSTVSRRLARALGKLRGWLGGEAESLKAAVAPSPRARARAALLVAAAAALSAEAKASLAAAAAASGATAAAAGAAAGGEGFLAGSWAWVLAKLQLVPSAAATATAGVTLMTTGQKIAAVVAAITLAATGGYVATQGFSRGSAEATLASLPAPTQFADYTLSESGLYEIKPGDRIRMKRSVPSDLAKIMGAGPSYVDLYLNAGGKLEVLAINADGTTQTMALDPDNNSFQVQVGGIIVVPEMEVMAMELIAYFRRDGKDMFGIVAFNRPDLLKPSEGILSDYREGRISRRQVSERLMVLLDKEGVLPADPTLRSMMPKVLERLN